MCHPKFHARADDGESVRGLTVGRQISPPDAGKGRIKAEYESTMQTVWPQVHKARHYLLHFSPVDSAEARLAFVFVQVDMEDRGAFSQCRLHRLTDARTIKTCS